MAKAKSSQQEDLTKSKTGIDMTAGFNFAPISTPVAKEESKPVEEKKEVTVDKKVEETTNMSTEDKASAKKETGGETKKSTVEKPKTATKSAAKKAKTASSKLQRPEDPNKDDTVFKISALISSQAKQNLEKYAKLYGYKKLSPFINDLFEHLDAYMDEEE